MAIVKEKSGEMMENRINIVVGHYGSGKTEFAINFALQLREQYDTVYLVDLDIVNPYFRSNDAKGELEKLGVSVIASEYAGTNVDIPALPAEILRVFHDKNAAVVFDVGGDDDGAIALGRFKQFFDEYGYNMYLAINIFRPMTQEPEQIIEMLRNIEYSSRLKVTGLINNSNIAQFTEPKHLLEGQKTAEQVATETGAAVSFISGVEPVLNQLPEKYNDKKFIINRFLDLNF